MEAGKEEIMKEDRLTCRRTSFVPLMHQVVLVVCALKVKKNNENKNYKRKYN